MERKLQKILPKPTLTDLKVNTYFSSVSAKAIENGFAAQEVQEGSFRWLVIPAPPENLVIPNVGPRKECVRLLIDQEEKFSFQVLDVTLDTGKLNYEIIQKYLDQMKPMRGYRLCPEVENVYRDKKETLKMKPQALREWPNGIRYDHSECELWFNPKLIQNKGRKSMCRKCDVLAKSINKAVTRVRMSKTKTKKTPSKSTNLKYLTPKTRRRTLQKKTAKLRKQSKKLEKYDNFVCDLNIEQSEEMREIISKINGEFSGDLEELFKEHDKGSILKQIWNNDIQNNKTTFYKDQVKNKNSSSGSRYSVITYRVALAVFSRSPAAYES